MQAQRKPADPVSTAPLDNTAPAEAVVSPTPAIRQPTGDLPTSPALLLQEQIAARLAQAEAGTAATQRAVDAGETKWPMPLRIAAIVGLSLALWGGIFVATVILLT